MEKFNARVRWDDCPSCLRSQEFINGKCVKCGRSEFTEKEHKIMEIKRDMQRKLQDVYFSLENNDWKSCEWATEQLRYSFLDLKLAYGPEWREKYERK